MKNCKLLFIGITLMLSSLLSAESYGYGTQPLKLECQPVPQRSFPGWKDLEITMNPIEATLTYKVHIWKPHAHIPISHYEEGGNTIMKIYSSEPGFQFHESYFEIDEQSLKTAKAPTGELKFIAQLKYSYDTSCVPFVKRGCGFFKFMVPTEKAVSLKLKPSHFHQFDFALVELDGYKGSIQNGDCKIVN